MVKTLIQLVDPSQYEAEYELLNSINHIRYTMGIKSVSILEILLGFKY
jgi:hypothetical protein